MVKVLDASAIVQFFQQKSGHEQVRQLFLDAAAEKCNLLMTSVNWGEARYTLSHFLIDHESSNSALLSLPIRIVDVDLEMVSIAGDFKIKYKIGYCDGMAAALAKLYDAECITTDRDFNRLKDEIRVNLIGL